MEKLRGKFFAIALDGIKRFIPIEYFTGPERVSDFRYRLVIKLYLLILAYTAHFSESERMGLIEYRLKKVLRAANSSPWWRSRFKEAGISVNKKISPFDLLKKLLPVQKKDLFGIPREDFCVSSQKNLVWRATAGTDGAPIVWAHDSRSQFLEYAAYYLRSLEVFSFPVRQNLARKFFLMF